MLMNVGFSAFVYKFRLQTNRQQRIDSINIYQNSGSYLGVSHPDIDLKERIIGQGIQVDKSELESFIQSGNIKYAKILNDAIEKGYYSLPK